MRLLTCRTLGTWYLRRWLYESNIYQELFLLGTVTRQCVPHLFSVGVTTSGGKAARASLRERAVPPSPRASTTHIGTQAFPPRDIQTQSAASSIVFYNHVARGLGEGKDRV